MVIMSTSFRKKILCKETRLAFLCSYVTWLCINTWNHTDMLSHICPTILVFAVKYFWSFIIEKEIYISLLLIDIKCFDHVVSRWLCLDSVPKHFLHITIANYWLVNDMIWCLFRIEEYNLITFKFYKVNMLSSIWISTILTSPSAMVWKYTKQCIKKCAVPMEYVTSCYMKLWHIQK